MNFTNFEKENAYGKPQIEPVGWKVMFSRDDIVILCK